MASASIALFALCLITTTAAVIVTITETINAKINATAKGDAELEFDGAGMHIVLGPVTFVVLKSST